MAPSETERLIPAAPHPAQDVVAATADYGATRSSSSSTLSDLEDAPIKPDEVAGKVNKEFSEIWAVCLGLSTA